MYTRQSQDKQAIKIVPCRMEHVPKMLLIDHCLFSQDMQWSPGLFVSYLQSKGGCHRAALTEDGSLKGFILSDKTSEQGSIHRIVNFEVDKPYQHQGIGTRLFSNLAQELLNRGAKNVWLDVAKNDGKSRKFYEGYGFKIEDYPEEYKKYGVDTEQDHYMTVRAEDLRKALETKNLIHTQSVARGYLARQRAVILTGR